LDSLVAFGPAESPVADPGDPREELEYEKDAKLHAEKADEVDDGLFEPPCRARRLSIVSRTNRLGRICDGGKEESSVEHFEEQDEDWDADGGLLTLAKFSFHGTESHTSMARLSR